MRTAAEVVVIACLWVGASAAVLSRRRAIWTAGAAVAALAVAGLLALLGAPLAAAFLGAGGFAGAVIASMGRAPGRGGLLPAGSAPVLTLCVVVAALSGWIGGSVLTGPGGAGGRTAALVLIGLGAMRLVGNREPDRVAGPAILTALGVGVAAALAPVGLAAAAAAGGAAALAGVLARVPAPAP